MTAGSGASEAERVTATRDALIVATSHYDDSRLRRLRAPAKDAEELARVLEDREIGDFAVDVALDGTHATVSRALSRFFRNRRRDDTLVVHLSCHGIKDEDGHLYFATRDTDVDDLDATAIASDWLRRLMDKCMSRRLVLMLDCCYSGAIGRDLLARGDRGVHMKERFEGRGRVVITASDSVEYAFEGDTIEGEGRPSLFSAAVVEGLSSGAADLDGDGWVSVAELYSHVHDTVREATPNMSPHMWMLELEGDLLVARSPRGPRAGELPADLRQLMDSPYAHARRAAVDVLADLLDGHDPRHAAAARIALEELTQDDSRSVVAAASSALGGRDPARPQGVPEAPTVPDAPTDQPLEWEAGRLRRVWCFSHDDLVRDVAFSPDGRLLATGSDDRTARLWQLATGTEHARLTHDDGVRAVAFRPDGCLFATAGKDHTARLWDPEGRVELSRIEHDGVVRALAFSPDGALLATASDDGTAVVWDVEAGEEYGRVTHNAAVWTVAFSPAGTLLATGGADLTVRILTIGSGSRPRVLAHDGAVWALAFSRDGSLLATGCGDKTGRTWDPHRGKKLARLEGHESALRAVAFSPEGTSVVTASDDHTARIWDPRTGRPQAELRHEDAVPSIALAPDGALLATASRDKTARVWELGRWEPRATLRHEAALEAVAFSTDGALLATAAASDALVWRG